jgi:hypothetical protein
MCWRPALEIMGSPPAVIGESSLFDRLSEFSPCFMSGASGNALVSQDVIVPRRLEPLAAIVLAPSVRACGSPKWVHL